MVAAFGEPDWVAELPEHHLRPHVDAWCRQDARLTLTNAVVDDREAYVLDLVWNDRTARVGQVRAAVFSLIGSFAETATYVRQGPVQGDHGVSATSLRFEVGTGELASDAGFRPHGHTVVINVAGLA